MSESQESRPTAERLVFFTDAIAAIALTLLILPLLDTFSEKSEASLGEMIRTHLAPIGAFLLSFAVIFRIWWAHHRLFRHVETISRPLVQTNIVWSLAIVVMPIATAIIAAYPVSATSVAVYEGTLVLATASMTVMAWYVYRHPEHAEGRPRQSRDEVLGHVAVLVTQVAALVVGVVWVHPVNFWGLLLMFLSGSIEKVVKAQWRRRDRAAVAA